ncbi:hypothetical protein Slin15195_G027330 [Septoria linicola]|uniref:Rhodopsin domain-containing protein n=1 Tax=Septoria linicola TaxID=215465 RepID=A0A9Q9AHB8_9PEZI|nr:hypothetical protein Slin15195_G027330 [Septoria linicola]
MSFNAPGPGDKRNGIFAVSAIFLSTVWITLSLRIWVRLAIIKNQGWDDALLVFAALIFTGYCVVVIMIETIGGAPKVNELDFAQLNGLVGMVIASFDLYVATMIFFKISLALFYLRIVMRTWQRYTVVATAVLNTVYGIFLFSAALFNCGDPSRYLENELKGVCMTVRTIYIIQLSGCIINATTDWIFAILPIFVLAKATMPLRTRVSAGFILLLACCGSIVSMVRIRYLEGLKPGPDFFSTAIDLCIWTIVECGLGISAASAATLRPLFHSLMIPVPETVSRSSIRLHCKALPGYSAEPSSSYPFSPPDYVHDLEDQGYISRFSRWSLAPTRKSDFKPKTSYCELSSARDQATTYIIPAGKRNANEYE